jgi:hypothetical protein
MNKIFRIVKNKKPYKNGRNIDVKTVKFKLMDCNNGNHILIVKNTKK